MDMSDDTLLALFRTSPINVPTTMMARCARLLDEGATSRLIRTATQRRPRNERERQILLHYAMNKGVGGVLFIDSLDGFSGQRPN